MLKLALLGLIKLYQKTLSLNHGLIRFVYPNGGCRFRPTCSEYTYQAVRKHGILKGCWSGLKRILKCQPFNQGGWDPLK